MNVIEVIIRAVDESGGVLSGFKDALGGVADVASGVFTAGMTAAAAGVGALAAEITLAGRAAMESEEVQNRLGSVLKSTGGVAGVTAEMANGLAASLQKTTRFSDEAILSGENLLLTFTNVGKDIFPQATETALDLSQALGQDLKSSNIQLGKALNDPLAGLTALSRVGVSFTEEQKNMIKALMGDNEELKKLGENSDKAQNALPKLQHELQVAQLRLNEMSSSGKASESQMLAQVNRVHDLEADISKANQTIASYSDAQQTAAQSGDRTARLQQAQKIILDELKREFGGAAVAAGQTFAGQLDILKNRVDEVQERIGGALLPVGRELLDKFITPAIPALESIGESLAKFISGLATGEDPIGKFANLGFELAQTFGLTKEQATGLFNSIVSLREPFEKLIAFISTGDVKGALGMIFPPEVAAAIVEVMDAVVELGDAFRQSFPQMKAAGEDLMKWLVPALKTDVPVILHNIAEALKVLAGFWREHGDEVTKIVTTLAKVLSAVIGSNLVVITGLTTAALKLLTGDFSGAFESITNIVRTTSNLWTSILGTSMSQIVQSMNSNWNILKSSVSTSLMTATSDIQNFAIRAGQAFMNLGPSVGNAVRDLTSRIGQGLADLPRQAMTAAQNFVNGLLSGIANGTSQLVQSIGNLARSMISTFTGIFGIHSDSSVMEAFGRNITGGLAGGIVGDLGRPSAAVASMVPALTGAAAGATNINTNTRQVMAPINIHVYDKTDAPMVEAIVRRVISGG